LHIQAAAKEIFGVICMSEKADDNDLNTAVDLVYNSVKNKLQFKGFSTKSLEFFNEFPVIKSERYDWWNERSDIDYQQFLKPEFNALVKDLTLIISEIDHGIETNLSKNVGSPIVKDGPRAHRWAAIHTRGRDKRIDVQFFINLTSKGLRVGIYFGQNKVEPTSWKGFIRYLHSSKEMVFQQVCNLQKQGYSFINTTHQDYVNDSLGLVSSPLDSQVMYEHIFRHKEFDIMKLIETSELRSKELVVKILGIFIETRAMYELLQLSKFNRRKRTLVNSNFQISD